MGETLTVPLEATRRLHAALRLGEGDAPFPWQERLLGQFLSGIVPQGIDVPTGLGKTAVMAIWAVAHSMSSRTGTGGLPRRLVYVVDRRAVVDQATREAERLRAWIEENEDVKESVGLDGSLPISTLRGQFADNRQWLEDPARPAVIVGTVDMVGSRLLFEGYGVSRKMRPIHAGLLGTDTLFVVDEAHLVPPFEQLLHDIAVRGPQLGLRGSGNGSGLVPVPRLLPLTATARTTSSRESGVHPLRLESEDLEHPVVARRLTASKRLLFERIDDPKSMPDALAARAWQLSEDGRAARRVVVYCNRRSDAEATKATIEKIARRELGKPKKGEPPYIDTALFVGGRRVHERMAAADTLASLGFLAGTDAPRERPAFLFATSAAEVGVDLDADHMVSDLVEFERMVQRLGRVNRRGNGSAEVHVLYDVTTENSGKTRKSADESERERYARARREVLERLGPLKDGGFDASPASLSDLQTRAREDDEVRALVQLATTPAPLRPEVERPVLEAWSMTSLRRHTGRPEVAPWLRGWIDDEPRTTVVWRRHFPPFGVGGEESGKRALERFFEAAPPHLLEKLEVETSRAVTWFRKRVPDASSKPDGPNSDITTDESISAVVLGPSLDVLEVWPSRSWPRHKKRLERTLRGATLVVAADVAGLSVDGLLDEKHTDAPSTPEQHGHFGFGDAEEDAQDQEPPISFRIRQEVISEGAVGRRPGARGGWRERYRTVVERDAEGDVAKWLIVDKWQVDSATEEDRSMATRPQRLVEHQTWVEDRVRMTGSALGLPESYIDLLALAARLHDEGKRARRWRSAFNAPDDGHVYAKTQGPFNVHELGGYRHELGSLMYVERDPDFKGLGTAEQDLVLHLVAAHHGFARPVISTSGFDDLPPTLLEERGQEVALRFARLQEEWGPWGLAWWEALLRSADQWASRRHDRTDRLESS